MQLGGSNIKDGWMWIDEIAILCTSSHFLLQTKGPMALYSHYYYLWCITSGVSGILYKITLDTCLYTNKRYDTRFWCIIPSECYETAVLQGAGQKSWKTVLQIRHPRFKEFMAPATPITVCECESENKGELSTSKKRHVCSRKIDVNR